MGKSLLALPTREGWTFSWYTGQTAPRTKKLKDGTRKVIGEIRFKNSFQSTSREKVEAKRKEIIEQGFEIADDIAECFF